VAKRFVFQFTGRQGAPFHVFNLNTIMGTTLLYILVSKNILVSSIVTLTIIKMRQLMTHFNKRHPDEPELTKKRHILP